MRNSDRSILIQSVSLLQVNSASKRDWGESVEEVSIDLVHVLNPVDTFLLLPLLTVVLHSSNSNLLPVLVLVRMITMSKKEEAEVSRVQS